uniref:Uncharacterized protein n=1 Tax=Rhizophagus irregularis (strain DAOM 181602 / DAOM 197198 / MUCL 43194) TaxID=747089 RepID=U9TUL2_RHIID
MGKLIRTRGTLVSAMRYITRRIVKSNNDNDHLKIWNYWITFCTKQATNKIHIVFLGNHIFM